jgi:hypothetical protein
LAYSQHEAVGFNEPAYCDAFVKLIGDISWK